MTCVDHAAYMRPKPEAVARLVASHGLEAATTRWHWMDERTLCAIARTGRAALGEAPLAKKSRSFTDEDAAVAVEASYVLGSTTRGERAAGIYDNGGRSCFDMRGLDYVRVSAEERGRAARVGHAANRGDDAAIAERDALHAHEVAVGRVIRAALRLIPEQPATGRYVLPPVGDALRAALAGEDPTAAAAVFPKLDLTFVESPPTEPEVAAMSETTLAPTSEILLPEAAEEVSQQEQAEEVVATPARAVHPRRRMPDDETLRADHSGSDPASVLAARYGVTVNGVYQAWRRLGLQAGGRPRKPKRRTPLPRPATEMPALGTDIVVYADLPPGRLPLADLALALKLARDTGITREEAIAWVRADAVAARRS